MVRSPLRRARPAWFFASCFVALVSGACGDDKPPPSRWDSASSARPTTGAAPTTPPAKPAAAEPPAAEGGAFNKFFPADGVEGTKRTFSQEKTGFAEAKLQKDGKDLAVLSIADTSTNPDARDKFKAATEKVKGHPVMTVGKNQTTVLVNDRFQVKVSSQTLDDAARRAWLERFDFAGLEKLAAAGGK
jgi:hypothetical protein